MVKYALNALPEGSIGIAVPWRWWIPATLTFSKRTVVCYCETLTSHLRGTRATRTTLRRISHNKGSALAIRFFHTRFRGIQTVSRPAGQTLRWIIRIVLPALAIRCGHALTRGRSHFG
jgi:hypothetical protein